MGRGKLIVLEGVDGAGTSTQAARLSDALKAQGFPVHVTREPSDGPIGVLIRQVLTRRMVVPGRAGPRAPRMETMALLFAADRVDHLESEMLPNLGDGITVICDRYVHSSIAYQSLTARSDDDQALEWVTMINSRARKPDLVMVLDVPPEVAARRRAQRGGAEEIYEHDALQNRLRDFYAGLADRFLDQPVKIIDGARSEEEVHADCLAEAMKHLRECQY
jgi:dTMP kinase